MKPVSAYSDRFDTLPACAAAGADQWILTSFPRDAAGLRSRLEQLATTLLPAAQRL